MVFYFVTKKLMPNSLLPRFVDGDDEFRNSRFKLIPSVPKISAGFMDCPSECWQYTLRPCLLGKAVDITYIRGPDYLEIDVDIGSSTVANGVLGLVFGVITTLVIDMAFLVQGIQVRSFFPPAPAEADAGPPGQFHQAKLVLHVGDVHSWTGRTAEHVRNTHVAPVLLPSPTCTSLKEIV